MIHVDPWVRGNQLAPPFPCTEFVFGDIPQLVTRLHLVLPPCAGFLPSGEGRRIGGVGGSDLCQCCNCCGRIEQG